MNLQIQKMYQNESYLSRQTYLQFNSFFLF